MLSVFPELFNFAPIAPLLIRIALGIFLFAEGHALLVKNAWTLKEASGWYRVAGVFLCALSMTIIVGVGLQIAALISIVWCSFLPHISPERGAGRESIAYALAMVLSISLLFLGPGIFAIDLPL